MPKKKLETICEWIAFICYLCAHVALLGALGGVLTKIEELFAIKEEQ